jgi:tRNA(fMet)-specific endonuclease VapC
MKRVLVDTSAYSAFMRGRKEVVEALQIAEHIFLNPIVLGELRAGFAAGGRREKNETELQQFLSSPRVAVALLDEETSVFYASIYSALRQAGTPIPTNDLWIASTAMQLGLCLLTTDAHFRRVQSIILECFE